MCEKQKKTVCGFTLLEVMISAFLIILIIGGMLTSYTTGRRTAAMLGAQAVAMHQARACMECIFSHLYDSSELGTGVHQFSELNLGMNPLPDGNYAVSYNTSTNYVSQSVKDVVVRVNWVEIAGSETSSVVIASSMASALH